MSAIVLREAPSGLSILQKESIGHEALLKLGIAFGDIHGWAIDLALKIRAAPPLVCSSMTREALTGLVKLGLITSKEAELFGGLADAMNKLNVSAAQEALVHITLNLGDTKSAIAAMLASIASDSVKRDSSATCVDDAAQQLPPGARAVTGKVVLAWVADVAAGAVGGAAGGAVANVPGALLLGGVAAAAASGALL